MMEEENVKVKKSDGEESFIEMDISMKREREDDLVSERKEEVIRDEDVK
jgi:hypothetical protein